MSKIIFNSNPNVLYGCQFEQIGNHQVRLIMEKSLPEESVLLSGFVLVNEHNGRVQTKRTDYIYIYKTYTDGKTIELCNDGVQWVEPKKIISFTVNNGGSLDGECTQIVDTYEELIVPTPIADENYVFSNWSPEIPTTGNVKNSEGYTAIFIYVPTQEELDAILEINKLEKIDASKTALETYLKNNPLISSCHNDIEASYTVTSEKQALMTTNYLAYTLAVETGVQSPSLTWNSSGNECEIWTQDEFKQLIVEVSDYVKPLVLQQQLYEIDIKNCSTQEELDDIKFVYV